MACISPRVLDRPRVAVGGTRVAAVDHGGARPIPKRSECHRATFEVTVLERRGERERLERRSGVTGAP